MPNVSPYERIIIHKVGDRPDQSARFHNFCSQLDRALGRTLWL